MEVTVEMNKRKITANKATEARNGGKEGHRKGRCEKVTRWTRELASSIL